jgi:hypothetical protein
MANLETYGDLKKLIDTIKRKQKGEKIISKGKEVALDTVLGFIPGASAAKTAYDFFKAAIEKPDTKKTNTWLDKLDIDDDMSKIIDDTVENGFMQAITKSIESESDDKKLEDDFNMNQKMVDYLKDLYGGRTITGIKENNMNNKQLVDFLKEEIAQQAPDGKLQGSINPQIVKDLGVKDVSKFTTVINLVKNNKVLNPAANKILADIFIQIIKSDDDALLNKLFSNIKQLKTK